LAWIGQMINKFGIINQKQPIHKRGWREKYKKGFYGGKNTRKSASAMSA